MQGWVQLHRKIIENPIWEDKPFSKGQAFIDLILMANHKEARILIGNEVVHINIGQLYTSELKLADRWGWSRKKVRAYLKLLEIEEMGTAKGTSKGTTITITNYTNYQGQGTTEDTAKEHQRNNKRTSKGTQTIMYNNDNNEKNVRERHALKSFGKFKNVLLTESEYKELKDNYEEPSKIINNLSTYKESNGKNYKNDYAMILRFSERDNYPKKKRFEPIVIENYNSSEMPEDIREKIGDLFRL